MPHEIVCVVCPIHAAVYMSKHRPLWENSHVFTNSLSEKPTSAPAHDDSDPPPVKRSAVADSTTDRPTQEYGPGSLGCTYELCAGLVDKSTSREQIAKEEILEETGYDIPVQSLEFINSHYSSIGTGGTNQSMYYCEVTDNMLVTKGGGSAHEGELIEVVYVPVDEAMKVVFDSTKAKSVGLCFAFLWFNQFKRPHLEL